MGKIVKDDTGSGRGGWAKMLVGGGKQHKNEQGCERSHPCVPSLCEVLKNCPLGDTKSISRLTGKIKKKQGRSVGKNNIL